MRSPRLPSVFIAGCLVTGAAFGFAVSARAFDGVEVSQQARLTCFPQPTVDASGRAVFCETSALVLDSPDTILLASDKDLHHGAQIMRAEIDPKGCGLVDTQASPVDLPDRHLLLRTRKIEAMTRAHIHLAAFAVSGLDRLQSAEDRARALLVAWPSGRVGEARDVPGLLESILAVEKSPYFKIEGMALTPDDGHLIFAIRETGNSYKDFRYRFLLIQSELEWQRGMPVRVGRSSVLLDLEPGISGLGAAAGVSSVEIDARGTAWFLVSSETETALSGRLMRGSLEGLRRGEAPVLVRQRNGDVLSFDGKPEGLAVISNECLAVVHDDDRSTSGRVPKDPNQALMMFFKAVR